MNPEIYNYTMEVLFNEGALDVYRTPILMKKDRFGVILNIMCREEDREKLKEIVFKETTSIGIREYKVKRTKLNRKFQGVDTIYGEVKIKKSYYKGKLVNLKPEYDDCKKLAKKNCISINSVYNEVYRNIEEEAKDE